ncbi:MAG: ATP-grasp domain-containing protein [Phenylobacterium sp.]
MKAKWLLQTDVFNENLSRLSTELEKQGFEYKVVKYIPFQAGEYNQFEDDDCVIFYGSLNLAVQLQKQKQWIPGPWCCVENLCCKKYYNYFGNHLLNNQYIMLPFKEIIRQFDFVKSLFGNDIFIRPDSGLKPFAGQAASLNSLKIENLCDEYVNEDYADLLCVVSSAKEIKKEWRVVIADKKAIAGSQYKIDCELEVSPECPSEILSYAEYLALSDWEPDIIYTMDIGLDKNGGMRLVELNSFSCSGLYDCDLSKIVEVASELAIIEWKEYQ